MLETFEGRRRRGRRRKGMQHTNTRRGVMYPYQRGFVKEVRVSSDEVKDCFKVFCWKLKLLPCPTSLPGPGPPRMSNQVWEPPTGGVRQSQGVPGFHWLQTFLLSFIELGPGSFVGSYRRTWAWNVQSSWSITEVVFVRVIYRQVSLKKCLCIYHIVIIKYVHKATT